MTLNKLLDRHHNPTGKLYDPVTGHLYLPMCVDAGEVKYLRLWYFLELKQWRDDGRATFVNKAKLRPAIGVTEEDLIALAQKAWEDAA